MTKKKLDFEKLFLYKHKLPIEKDGKVVGHVYQRLLNDADTEYARAQSLRASGEFRQALRDETSDSYYSFIAPIADLDKRELIAHTLIQEMGSRRERLQREIPPNIPPKPSPGASLEQHEEYQAKLDAIEEKWHKRISKSLEVELQKRKEELEEMSAEELFPILRRALAERLCSLRMINSFQTWCAFLGTYVDVACTQRYFDEFEAFQDLPTEVLEQLIDGYFKLNLGIDEVKK